jgi:hypothetical protein
MLNKSKNSIAFFIFNLKRYESVFLKYQGYNSGRLLLWCQNSNFKMNIIRKLLKHFLFFNGEDIRKCISQYIEKNKNKFINKNIYITNLSYMGKSGHKIIYELKHSKFGKKVKIVETHKLLKLPRNSKIIFVDDLIGTGKQSVKYINEKINPIVNSSCEIYLFTIVATYEGKKYVENNTQIKEVYVTKLLEEKYHNHYSKSNMLWSSSERKYLIEKNKLINQSNTSKYDKGLLVAFFYAVPNNTMPIIWKNNIPYIEKEKKKKWYALLPREY